MGTDELRAAAERQIDHAYPPVDMRPGTHRLRFADGEALARAWLADHPADDSTPVDEDWLRSVGFQSWYRFGVAIAVPAPITGNVWLVCTDTPNASDCPWEVWNVHKDEDGDTSDKAMIREEIPTRGSVRRLLAALGVAQPPALRGAGD